MKPLYRERSFGIEARGNIKAGEWSHDAPRFIPYSLETMLQQANLLRHYYGLEHGDIHGEGLEDYQYLVPLVRHCCVIGLRPTVVTHGRYLFGSPGPIHQLEDAGLEDWLISLHGGTSASHDALIGDAGSFDRLVRGLDLVQRPVRFTTTLTDGNYADLPWKVLSERPPTVWDVVMFGQIHTLTKCSHIAPHLKIAIEELEARGWEVNVRYWPICLAEKDGFAENVCGHHQAAFDPWDYRANVAFRIPLTQVEAEGGWHEAERMRATMIVTERQNDVCAKCRYRTICDKPTKGYQEHFGLEEFTAVKGEIEHDPLVFQKKRAVLVR